MLALLLSAVVTCALSLFIGQAVLRLSGAREWNWLAPAVGLSVVMLITAPTLDVPGRSVTAALVVGPLALASIVWCMSSPAHRPPLGGLLAALPVAGLVLVPFLAIGRSGILGVSMDNDLGPHMFYSEIYLSDAVRQLELPFHASFYPFGPHGMVAMLAEVLSIRVDHAFNGWIMALPLVNAWTAVALVRRAWWPKQALTATIVGLPFLVAAYYGEGSFKEVAQTGLVLATVLLFAGYGPKLGRGRWVPLALLAAGMVSVYSITGLTWPIVIGGLWLIGVVVERIIRRETGSLLPSLRGELPAIGIGMAVLVGSLLPQAVRIQRFISENAGQNGIIVPKDVLGNLIAPLPGWQVFGVWNSPDFRLPASPAFSAGMWSAFVLGLVIFGVWWFARRGRWELPLAAAGAMLIWRVSRDSQSPYVVAKALVIASPLVLAVALLPLLEQVPERRPRLRSAFKGIRGQPLSWGVAAALALLLFFKVGQSDLEALRVSPVGATNHVDQLRELRPLLDDERTLFLGNDDFIRWALAGVPLTETIFGAEQGTPIRREKGWENGMALDFDVVSAHTLNSFNWVITTRDAAGSEPPPQMHLVRSTESYELWRRVGRVRERFTLHEGGMPGAVLNCDTTAGRAVLRGGGVAAVRPRPIEVTAPLLGPNGEANVHLPLGEGRWNITSSYQSRLPVDVSAPGLETTLPPNLDRGGPRWPVGEIDVGGSGPTVLAFSVGKPLLAPDWTVANLSTVVATPAAPKTVIPVARACGRFIDWYRPA